MGLAQTQQARSQIMAKQGKIPPADLDHALTTTNMSASLFCDAAKKLAK